jgi:hypothetical protein
MLLLTTTTPMRRTRSGCCARAASGHATPAPPAPPRWYRNSSDLERRLVQAQRELIEAREEQAATFNELRESLRQ